jgi:hypothetical protein
MGAWASCPAAPYRWSGEKHGARAIMRGVPLRLPHLPRAFPLLLTVVGVGIAAFTWMQVVQTISSAKPGPVTTHASSIVWGDRVYESPTVLARWLRARGASYARWQEKHSVASALLEHRPVPTAKPKPKPKPKPKVPANAASKTPTGTLANGARHTTATQAPVAVSVSSGASQGQRIFIALLALLAAVFALAASLPRAVCNRFPNLARWIAPYRALLLAGAGALMVGILAGAVLN